MKQIAETDLDWLKGLEARLWEHHTSTMRANMSGHTWQQSYSTSRKEKLTKKEWQHVQKLIKDHELPVGLGSANFCFGLALHIYGHANPPAEPEHLTSISGEHLPDYKYPRDRGGFEIGWKHFESIARTARNAELLEFYEMEPIKDKGYYDY